MLQVHTEERLTPVWLYPPPEQQVNTSNENVTLRPWVMTFALDSLIVVTMDANDITSTDILRPEEPAGAHPTESEPASRPTVPAWPPSATRSRRCRH